MCDAYHKYDNLVVQHFVDHAIPADANPPKATQFTLQHASGQWLLRETIDGPHDPDAIMSRDPRYFLRGASLNPNRVAHA